MVGAAVASDHRQFAATLTKKHEPRPSSKAPGVYYFLAIEPSRPLFDGSCDGAARFITRVSVAVHVAAGEI
jgi:hypothetical protein